MADTDRSRDSSATHGIENLSQGRESYYPEDEISLVDLWNVLVRRRLLIAAVMALCIAAAFVYVLMRSDVYLFTSILEIGHYPNERGELSSLDSVENALSKLADGYIPDALRRFMDESPDQAALRIDTRSPRGSSLLVMEVKGFREEGESLQRVLRHAGDRLIQDHDFLLNIERQRLEADLEKAKLELAQYEDERVFQIRERELLRVVEQVKLQLRELEQQQVVLDSRIKRLDDSERLLKQQIEEIRQAIDTAAKTREAALGNVNDPARAMTLLMIDNEVQQNRNRLAILEERLHIGLPNEFDDLQKRLDDVRGAQTDMKAEIEARESELERFRIEWKRMEDIQRQSVRALEARHAAARETRVVSQPAQSVEPVGPGKAVILALAGMGGLMLGVFAAFFAEFLNSARQASARSAP